MRQITLPEGWFSRPMSFVPLFNPSLLTLKDGSFLVALRMSNGRLGAPATPICAAEARLSQRACRAGVQRGALQTW